MPRQNIVNNKQVDVKPGDIEQIKMNKWKGYSVQAYSHAITIHHDNAAALDSAITVYDFVANALSKITLQIGAGNEMYDLNLTAHLVRQLETRKRLIYTIDKTSGAGKTSVIELIIDFVSLGFLSPKDTILYEVGDYDHLLTEIKANAGTGITNCTVTKTNVSIAELFKTDVNLLQYVAQDGTTKTMEAYNKKPIFRQPSFNSDNPQWEIEIPKGVSISRIIMYVTDGGSISTGHFNNFIVKNALKKSIDIDAPRLERWNRESLKEQNNADWDGIYVLDMAMGSYKETLDTIGLDANSFLELNIVKGGATEPILNIIYETVDKARKA